MGRGNVLPCGTYYEGMKLLNGDCLKEMKQIKSGSIDAIICDPPYGTTACKWDSVIPFDLMWEQLNRIIKPNGAIVLFGSEPFSSALRMSNIKNYKYDWVWDKVSGGNPFNNKIMPMKTTENVMLFEKKGKKVNYYPIMEEAKKENIRPQIVSKQKSEIMGKFKNGFIPKSDPNKRFPKHIISINVRNKEVNSLNRVHPTQKPVALMEYLIKTYTNEGETVLDFTMGSGSTMVACQNTNRNGIGIEQDENYFKIAKQRIKENEYKLF
jgi:site-specific DNA-methyltransferase (adenine-specific)